MLEQQSEFVAAHEASMVNSSLDDGTLLYLNLFAIKLNGKLIRNFTRIFLLFTDYLSLIELKIGLMSSNDYRNDDLRKQEKNYFLLHSIIFTRKFQIKCFDDKR